jgi:uncharacterized protein (DUF2345 family)
MAANSANSRTRTQQTPPNQFLRHNKVTPTSQEVTGWDIAGGILHYVARMAAEGFSVEEHSHDGHSSRIQHGDHHEAVQGRTADTTGHHDERVQGGHRNQNNSEHHETGGDSTKATDGSHQQTSSSSAKNYTQGDGHHHMQGDQAFTVEEGGVHYNVAKDFSVTATGDAIHLDSKKELSFKSGGNETHVVGNTLTITAVNNIQFRVGNNVILINHSGISISTYNSQIQLITSGSGNILIDSENGNVSIAAENGPIKIEAAQTNTIKSKQGTKLEASTVPPLPWDGTL